MVSYDWVDDVVYPIVVFFRHGMISGLWVELVLRMGMKFMDKIVL